MECMIFAHKRGKNFFMPAKSAWYGVIEFPFDSEWKATIQPPLNATDNMSDAIKRIENWKDISPIASKAALSELVWMSIELIRLANATSRVITGTHNMNRYPILVKQKIIEDKNCCMMNIL